MSLIVRRKLHETWRDAVAARAGARRDTCLARFDALLASGRSDAEAAYRTLEEAALLWRADEPGPLPGDPSPSPDARPDLSAD